MEGPWISLLLCAFVVTVTGNTAAQRFQAEKFLDMLGRTYDPKIAFVDLLSALHQRLNLDVASSSNGSASTADAGSLGSNTMAEATVSCMEAPPMTGAIITYTSSGRVLGSRALYQCEEGYKGKSKFIQCGQGGQWSALTDIDGCVPVNCGAAVPQVQNADSSFTTTTYKSVVLYNCQAGYTMNVADANVTCLETGVWDTPTFTCDSGGVQPDAGFPKLPAGIDVSNNPMAAMIAKMFPNLAIPTPPTTPAPSTTSKPETQTLPGGLQLPSHLKNLLPNGLSSSSGIRPQDLMTLASVGLGSANPGAAPKDISHILGSMHPMALFGGGLGLNPGGPGAAGGPGSPPPDPELMAERREEMMMRAMMATAMKSMMGPSGQNSGTGSSGSNNNNPAMEMMTLMALQNGLGAGGATGGAAGGAGAVDPIGMMLGMGGAGGGGLFGSLMGA